jgi:tetratricopeptide (TPR) repeat protein
MASFDAEEVVEEDDGDSLPELGAEPDVEPAAEGPVRLPPPTVLVPLDHPADLPSPRPSAPAPPRAAPAAVDLTDELEEADFFAQQGLLTDAREALLQLQAVHPGHPVLEARLADVERRLAARTAPPAAPGGPASDPRTTSAAPPAPEPRATRQSPSLIEPVAASAATFDLGADLAEEIARAPALGGVDDEFQYSVEDVFNQFKKGVAETVGAEDSDTHYDLGIAYKEMGLLDDAIGEFETALRGSNKRKEIDSLAMIALCRMSQGNAKEAIVALRRALRSDFLTRESAKAIYFELGVAHEALGEGEVGLWFLQKVLKLDPGYRDVAGRVASLGGGPGTPPADLAGPGKPGGPRRAAAPSGGSESPAGASAPAGVAQTPAAGVAGAKKNIGFL